MPTSPTKRKSTISQQRETYPLSRQDSAERLSHCAAVSFNQAFHALLFLFGQVLGIELPRLDAVRAKRPKRLPTVLSPEEVRRFLDAVEGGEGLFRLVARLARCKVRVARACFWPSGQTSRARRGPAWSNDSRKSRARARRGP